MAIKKYHVSKNLFPPTAIRYEMACHNDGYIVNYSGAALYVIPIEHDKSYIFKIFSETSVTVVRFGLYNKAIPVAGETVDSIQVWQNAPNPVLRVNNTTYDYVAIQVSGAYVDEYGTGNFMLNTGSTALPYEPSDVKHDTLTTLPSTIYTDGTPLNAWSIYGAMTQTGTPSPSAPIYPQEVGDRTENLFDADTIYGDYKQADGTFEGTARDFSIILYQAFTADDIGKTFTFTFDIVSTGATDVRACANINGSNVNGNSLSGAGTTTVSFTIATANDYIRVNYSSGGTNSLNISNIMLNSGSSPLPYEPYGVKLQIVSGDTTTTVYSNETIRAIGDYVDIKSDSQEYRVIKKLVLTGQENWNRDGTSSDITRYRIGLTDAYKSSDTYNTQFYISHYKIVAGGYTDNTCFLYNSNVALIYVCVDINTYPLPDDFKAYLAAQYAAGTPVTIWYVLSSPTTASVSTPQIPTSFGENIINVGTTLTPPRVDVAYTQYPWHEIPYYIYGTEQETITELPTEIMADGSNAIVSIYGNMQQNGTPTPSDPIYPSECGDRTENLFDINREWVKLYNTDTVIVSGNSVTITSTYYAKVKMPVPRNTDCAIKAKVFEDGVSTDGTVAIYESDSSTRIIYRAISNTQDVSFNTGNNDEIWIYLYASNGTEKTKTYSEIMLNTGSTALPYQPYGYIIHILCGNVTTNIYLGDVSSTRQIKKLVFTGEEQLWFYDSDYTRFGISITDMYVYNSRLSTVICSHYPCIDDGRAIADIPNNSVYVTKGDTNRFFVKTDNYATPTAFKTYLADQYANGTPVTIWYVLATPQTTTLNEPIRKIGDYADTVTSSTIPTTAAESTFDVDTTLKPSKVELTYHGWHPHSDKKANNGQWS